MGRSMMCPRCAGPLREPSAWSARWTCAARGVVLPSWALREPSAQVMGGIVTTLAVPLWLPWPLPRGWVLGALVLAGDETTGVGGAGLVLSGPHPLGGAADWVLVAEEPGVGLGAGLAGLAEVDPGSAVVGAPAAAITVSTHAVPLWQVDAAPDRASYAGEWEGCWLWTIFRPQDAGVLLVDDVRVADVRRLGREVDLLPYGTAPDWLPQVSGS